MTDTPKTQRPQKCIGTDCGHEPEIGYRECRSCEAKRRGVAFAVVARERSERLEDESQKPWSDQDGW